MCFQISQGPFRVSNRISCLHTLSTFQKFFFHLCEISEISRRQFWTVGGKFDGNSSDGIFFQNICIKREERAGTLTLCSMNVTITLITHTHTHTHTYIYIYIHEDHSENYKPHQDFTFVTHLSSFYGLHLHKNKGGNLNAFI